MTSKQLVIPAILEARSLLEAKVAFQEKASSLSSSMAELIKLRIDQKSLTTAPAPAVGQVYQPLDIAKQTTPDGLIQALRLSFKQHGALGIFGIARKFRIMDDNNDGQVDISEFKKAISEHAMNWTDAQIQMIFDFFDKDHSKGISYEEFLLGVREPMNDRRIQLVMMAFEVLDTDKSGVIEVSDLQGRYNTSKHPDVISGKRGSEDILR